MQKYISKQCQFMLSSLDAFEQSCEMAALANDGMIDDREAEELKKIAECTQAYREALTRLMQKAD